MLNDELEKIFLKDIQSSIHGQIEKNIKLLKKGKIIGSRFNHYIDIITPATKYINSGAGVISGIF